MNHGTPRDSSIARELAPSELDTPMPLSPVKDSRERGRDKLAEGSLCFHHRFVLPFRSEIRLETASGMVEPAARKVRPITIVGTCMATPKAVNIQTIR